MVVVSLLWGPQLWIDWLTSLSRFNAIVGNLNLHVGGLTPASAARMIELPLWALPHFQAGGIIAGIALVWWGFRTADLPRRLVALSCGSLLRSPYALMYDLVVLVPLAVTMLFGMSSLRLAAGLVVTGLGGLAGPLMMILNVLPSANREAKRIS